METRVVYMSRDKSKRQELNTEAGIGARYRSCIHDPGHGLHNGIGIGTKAPYRSRDKSQDQQTAIQTLYAVFGTGARGRS